MTHTNRSVDRTPSVRSLLAAAGMMGIVAALGSPSTLAQTRVMESPLRTVDPNDQSVFTRLNVNMDLVRSVTTDEPTTWRNVPIGRGGTVDVVLRPFEIFSPDARVVIGGEHGDTDIARPDVVLLKGTVNGREDSSVFIGVSPMMTHGVIRIGATKYFISSGPTNADHGVVVFDEADLPKDPDARTFTCGADQIQQPLALPVLPEMKGAGEVGQRGTFTCRSARVAVDTVWEHTRDLFGGDPHRAATYDTILFGAISEIYTRDLNLHIAVPFLRVWATDNDPYNPALNTVLDQFRNHWSASMGSVQRTLAHILTTDGLNGAGGVAWLNVVCNTSYGYGASGYLGGSFPYPLQDGSGGNWDLVVTSHELGHNFGAVHTHDYNPPVDSCGLGNC